jgi:hypothetical protein
LVLLSWVRTNTMELGEKIRMPDKVSETKFPVMFDSIKPINKNIESLNLSEEEINSLNEVISNFDLKLINYFITALKINKENFHYYLFYSWLFQENMRNYCKDELNFVPNSSSGYFFFGGNTRLDIEIKYQNKNKLTVKQYWGFNGKMCTFDNAFFHYQKTDSFDTDAFDLKKILGTSMYSLYKIHLMPTEKTLYNTLYKLFLAIRQNPKITDDFSLRDLIHNIKVQLNPGKAQNNQFFPTIVLYIPTIFGEKSNFEAHDFFEKFSQYVDYKKSKYYLTLLLSFLIDFFEKNKDCEGSGVIPRFNNKVTDMIFFAQGNGGEKIDTYKEYFEEDFLYFKSLNGEDFKVDVPKLFEEKAQLQPPENKLQQNILPVSPVQIPTQTSSPKNPPSITLPSSPQSSLSTDKKPNNNNPSENSGSIWISVKNFFYTILSSFIYFITGIFTFN